MILLRTISDGLTAPQEDDDSPGYSRLLNESILNEIFSQPGMSNLAAKTQEQKSREEGRATEVASS